jgi:hypothetical protein
VRATTSAFEAALSSAYPPITSFASVNGPSVTRDSPPAGLCTRTPIEPKLTPSVAMSQPAFIPSSTSLCMVATSASEGGRLVGSWVKMLMKRMSISSGLRSRVGISVSIKRRTGRARIDRPRRLFRAGALVSGIAALLGSGVAWAHDAFEITTDAHVSGELMTLHTTLLLSTATRMCFTGKEALRVVGALEFSAFEDRYRDCARDFYRVTAGGAALPVRDARVALTVEGDVEMWTTVPRPTRSPLAFDAVRLRRLFAPSAGVVLTVTGARTFLGQTVLRPSEATYEVAIGPDAEAPRAAPAPAPEPPGFSLRTLVLAVVLTVIGVGLVWVIRATVNRLTSRP